MTKLHEVVLEGGLGETHEKVGSLAQLRVQEKEKLIVDKRLYWLLEVVLDKHIVDEGEVEGLIAEIVVNLFWWLAGYTTCNAYFLGRRRFILALPKLDLNIAHLRTIKVSLKLVILAII